MAIIPATIFEALDGSKSLSRMRPNNATSSGVSTRMKNGLKTWYVSGFRWNARTEDVSPKEETRRAGTGIVSE
jgi:hypothetical protein